MPGEHFVLRDLPFYEEARKADAKARQECLEQRDERMQERKLGRVLDKKGRASSSAAYPPTEKKKKKKKTIVKVIKASTLALASLSTSTPSASNSADSSTQASEGDSSSSRLDPNDSGTCPSEPELESIAHKVINEQKEEEEDMSNNLRAAFKERHRKRLHEAIGMVPPPTKKAYPEGVREEPEMEVSPMPLLLPNVMGHSSVPAAEKEGSSALGGVFSGAAPVEEVLDQKDTLIPASPPSWDEMIEILKCLPCFTNVESPSTKMSNFFPLTKWISMNLGCDPPHLFQQGFLLVCLSSQSPAFSNYKIARCRRLQKW